MLMESFEVENFRSLKHLKLEKLARVNVLVGKNNSGKTSVLEALFCLTGISTPIWFETIIKERELPLSEVDFLQLFYRLDSANNVKLSAKYTTYPSGLYKMWLEVILQTAGSITRQASDELDWNTEKSFQRATSGEALSIELSTDSMVNPAYYELAADERRAFRRFNLQENSPGSLDAAKGIRVGGAFRTRVSFVPSHPRLRSSNSSLEQLKIIKADNKLVNVLRQIDNRIERIELVGGGIYFNLGADFPTLLPANLMGEGIQRLLLVISTIISRAGGLVLIDEIDNGLHYSALRVLWKGILQAAREYDVQVFATTHSAEALRHLTWVLDDEEYASYRDDIAAYTLIRTKDDTVKSFRYDASQLEFAMEHDIEVRN